VRLWGGVVPAFWDSIDEPLEDARVRLGDDDYAAALAEGASMDVDELSNMPSMRPR
jgi:hypothetical protein